MEAETATTDVPVVQVSEKIEGGKEDLIKVMLVTCLLYFTFFNDCGDILYLYPENKWINLIFKMLVYFFLSMRESGVRSRISVAETSN